MLLFVFLLSCNSPPVKINHYLLNTPNNSQVPEKHKNAGIVLLRQVNIADYLRQPNLVLLLEQHKLHYSPRDVWAESLKSAFSQALLQDLNHSQDQHYISASSPLGDQANISINIDLAHFHSTHLSTVVMSGRYWLSAHNSQQKKAKQVPITEHSFYYELDLQKDGFAHAVDQLRATLTLLSKKIEKDIALLTHN
jgi:hypothetical protein